MEEKFLWALHPRFNVISKYSYSESKLQYRYVSEGKTHTLRKEYFQDGIYKDNFMNVYYGFDIEALLQRAIKDEKAQIAKLEECVARQEVLLKKVLKDGSTSLCRSKERKD